MTSNEKRDRKPPAAPTPATEELKIMRRLVATLDQLPARRRLAVAQWLLGQYQPAEERADG